MWIMLTALALAQVDPVDPDYDHLPDADILALNCTQVALDADRFVGSCYSHQASIWDRRVAEEYAKALHRVDPEMKSHLRASQKAWKAYRKAKCALWDDVKGTLSVRLPPMCELETNKHRAAELAEIDGLAG